MSSFPRTLFSFKKLWNVACAPKQALIPWHLENKRQSKKWGSCFSPLEFSQKPAVILPLRSSLSWPARGAQTARQAWRCCFSVSLVRAPWLPWVSGLVQDRERARGTNVNVRGWNFHSWVCHKPKTVQKSLVVLMPVFRMALSWPWFWADEAL